MESISWSRGHEFFEFQQYHPAHTDIEKNRKYFIFPSEKKFEERTYEGYYPYSQEQDPSFFFIKGDQHKWRIRTCYQVKNKYMVQRSI